MTSSGRVSVEAERAAPAPLPRNDEPPVEAADVLRAKAWADGQRNAAWTEAHQRDLAAYAGHWVCIADARVAVADRNRKRFAARV